MTRDERNKDIDELIERWKEILENKPPKKARVVLFVKGKPKREYHREYMRKYYQDNLKSIDPYNRNRKSAKKGKIHGE